MHSCKTLSKIKSKETQLGDYLGRRTLFFLTLVISGMFCLKIVVIPLLLTDSEEITPTIIITRDASDPEAYAILQQIENQILSTITDWTYILSNQTLEGHITDMTESSLNIPEYCTTPSFYLYWNVSVTRNETMLNYSKLNVLWKTFDHGYIFEDIYLEDTNLFFWWDNGTKIVIDPYDPYQSNITREFSSITWIFVGLVKDHKDCRPLNAYWRMHKQVLILDHDLFPVVFAEGYENVRS